jgi:competence protein ComEA
MRKYGRILGLAIIILVFALSASSAFAQGAAKVDTGKASAQVISKVNINKATVDQLMEIKGIGASYAKRIVEYRDKNGPFKKIEDITEVKGIGSKTFESIKDLITI